VDATGQEMVRRKNSLRSGNYILSQDKLSFLRIVRDNRKKDGRNIWGHRDLNYIF